MVKPQSQKVRQAQRICAKLQTKLIYKHRWTKQDIKRWDFAINIITKSRERT